MAIGEVFANPTVVRVIFQVRFPNLFTMENLIGEYQTKIMERFPESQLGIRRNVLIADFGPEGFPAGFPDDSQAAPVGKIWSFTSPEGVALNVQNDSLDISSKTHKTYNNKDAPYRFRDMIQYALDRFLAVAKIPLIHRIGLRYVDDCPIPARTNDAFAAWYKTAFPLARFPMPDIDEMHFRTCVKRGDHFVRYAESLSQEAGRWKYTIDSDAFAVRIPAVDYLKVTDALHDLLVAEYEASIQQPVYDHMRQPKIPEKST